MQKSNNQSNVAICIPAYNEAKNIGFILDALLKQKTKRVTITKIVVVSSGSTDDTDKITLEYQKKSPTVQLIRQKTRAGKASAINAFLSQVDEPIIVIESADTVPEIDAIEHLCVPFLDDENIGMTGGAPFPVNDPETFLGYVIHTWWWFHRHIPRFGEIIAFRNILPEISQTTAVDEAFIQAKFVQQGMAVRHIDEAVVRNKGPETLGDLIKQRRRIFNGHSRLAQEEKIKIDNMTKTSMRLLFMYKPSGIRHQVWFLGGIGIEIYARILGAYDAKIKKINPFVWDTARSTKNLAKEMDYQGEWSEANEEAS